MSLSTIILNYILEHIIFSIFLLVVGFIFLFSSLSSYVSSLLSCYFQKQFFKEGNDKFIKWSAFFKISWDYFLLFFIVLLVIYLGMFFYTIKDQLPLNTSIKAAMEVALMGCSAFFGWLLGWTIRGNYLEKYMGQIDKELRDLVQSDYLNGRIDDADRTDLHNFIATYSSQLRNKETYKEKLSELSDRVYTVFLDKTLSKPYLRAAYLKEDNQIRLKWEYLGPNISYKLHRTELPSNQRTEIGPQTTTSFNDENIEKNKTYEYWLSITIGGTEKTLDKEKVVVSTSD